MGLSYGVRRQRRCERSPTCFRGRPSSGLSVRLPADGAWVSVREPADRSAHGRAAGSARDAPVGGGPRAGRRNTARRGRARHRIQLRPRLPHCLPSEPRRPSTPHTKSRLIRPHTISTCFVTMQFYLKKRPPLTPFTVGSNLAHVVSKRHPCHRRTRTRSA
jgi:hypothetical protein